MAARRMMNRLYYFTIEDESILSEAFSQLEKDVYAITYKVAGTEDVFVTTSETKDAMDRNDIPYNLLAEEDGSRIAVWHSPLSREELSDYEDAVRALALAYRAIAVAAWGSTARATSDSTCRTAPSHTPTSPRPPATPSSGGCSASATRRWTS